MITFAPDDNISSQMITFHLERNVIIWDEMLSSGANVIIWCCHAMLSCDVIFWDDKTALFYFS
jgi:hypothetical protein